MAHSKQKKLDFLEEYKNVLCNATIACKRTGVPYRTFMHWKAKGPQWFKDKIIEAEETKKDYVEAKLSKLIDDESPAAIMFWLKCKAKDRGYVERQEVTGADGGAPINITIVPADGNGD